MSKGGVPKEPKQSIPEQFAETLETNADRESAIAEKIKQTFTVVSF